MEKISPVGSQDIAAVEGLYRSYLNDPDSVDVSWRHFFSGFDLAVRHFADKPGFVGTEDIEKEFAILNLIHGYRQRGHLFTRTNPVRSRRKYSPTLDIENFGLEKSDLEKVFQAGNNIGIGPARLKDIIEHLEATYCQSIGVEFVYMRHPEVVSWLREKMETTRNAMTFSDEKRRHIFYHLKLAVGFENFIHKKFVGAKRFSLEGAETLIPSLDAVIERGAELGIEEFVIGMAHRGRLNVLANILQKPYENIFKEFYGTQYEDDISLGDVKYHLGYENEVMTDTGKAVKLKMMPNPSHLETVGALVQGLSRSRIDSVYGGDFSKVAPIVIHGDAAVAAQGVVYEVIQMAQLPGYKTGGTIHLVINNQVGFTTNYLEARSSTYCTDIAKVTRSPVFHVNGDDVEALIYTIRLAMEFRQKFQNDVFIDILCYRKYGHNEGDEPRFTQPTLYKTIASHPNPRDIYSEKLTALGLLSNQEARVEIRAFDQFMENKYLASEKIEKLKIRKFLVEEYQDFRFADKSFDEAKAATAVAKEKLVEIAAQINYLPEELKFFNKVNRIIADRKMMIHDNRLDWAMAELLAYGTLVSEGHPVRLSGQDSERGTFAHRHASFVIEDTDERYYPLSHIAENQAPFQVRNSLLSEYGVLGFEYGYALAQPNGLTIWEAQFGDFANVAQVIIDQYISSAAEKWGLLNGLVLLLPHGYEGQGPEHSSARLERFLTLAANNNMQIVVPTTPANFFHLLRRQVKWDIRLPLVVLTPKSLLRHPQVVSTLDEMAHGTFSEVIDDLLVKPSEVKKLVFTNGRLYFDLLKRRSEEEVNCVAIVRIEQLYPIPERQIREILKKYAGAKTVMWAQDEPENQGAWPFIQRKLSFVNWKLAARPESASPAGGLMELHKLRLQRLLDTVFEKSEVNACKNLSI
ncbi:MAG TPA: 2-oxoglutarate dehydrogenase E1 component [Prolixibacteraceae bacterium]|nr:2-oxoglutarate dehydrogenase E1 component [Prolixibacteraceae bacterium]